MVKNLQDYSIAEETELKKIPLAEQERINRAAIAEHTRQAVKGAGRTDAVQQQLEGL